MRVYLLDTNAASALWDVGDAHHADALRFVQNAASAGDVIYVSRIVIAEIEYGFKLYTSADPTRRSQADAAMRAFTSIREVRRGTTEHYSNIRAALFQTYAPRDSKNKVRNVRPEQLIDKTTALLLGIQESDLWMAAIAVEYNMIFVSDDKLTHIQAAWPSLKVVKWK
jgi:tRNA(fMet)-specific endonuclease VapC